VLDSPTVTAADACIAPAHRAGVDLGAAPLPAPASDRRPPAAGGGVAILYV